MVRTAVVAGIFRSTLHQTQLVQYLNFHASNTR